MVFHPVIHLFLLILITVVAGVFVFLTWHRAVRKNVKDVIRRSLIVSRCWLWVRALHPRRGRRGHLHPRGLLRH